MNSNVVKKGGNDEDRTTDDCISRTQAIDALRDYLVEKRCPDDGTLACRLIENEVINKLPSAQPFYIITMTDVMKFIDDMPEDAWLEFTECLACRGWELQRRTAKWCGGDFA